VLHQLRWIYHLGTLLRLHLLVLALLWFAVNTSQYSDVFAETPHSLRAFAMFGFYIVFLGSAFRLVWCTNHGNLATGAVIVLIGSAYYYFIPGYHSDFGFIVGVFLIVLIGSVCLFGEQGPPWILYLVRHAVRSLPRIPIASWFPFLALLILPVWTLVLLSQGNIATQIAAPVLVMVEASLWLSILTELQLWSTRITLPVVTTLVIWGIFLSRVNWNYRHEVRAYQGPALPARTVSDVFADWLRSREVSSKGSTEPYAVVLVAAEGGGIRAAYSTAMLLARLRDLYPRFAEHLFAISGVSGGSMCSPA
jgi:hypothetical protein